LGASANGLFAVAQKIPSVLSIISSIFAQSWQLSAIEEYDSKDRSNFYSKVFNNYSLLMFIAVSAILVVLKLLMKNIMSINYYLAWEVIPYLLIGSIFNSFSVFLGTNYIAARETKGVFKTTIFGSTITVILGSILIPFIGINGAGVSIMLSSIIMWIIRIVDTKKYILMTIDMSKFSRCLLIITLQVLVLNLNFAIIYEFIVELILFIILLSMNKSYIKNLYSMLSKK
jgi:O-antigen/teichoic acid export membrane protein